MLCHVMSCYVMLYIYIVPSRFCSCSYTYPFILYLQPWGQPVNGTGAPPDGGLEGLDGERLDQWAVDSRSIEVMNSNDTHSQKDSIIWVYMVQ